MASFNKCILVGNLTRDPELRYSPKGTAVAQMGLAVNRKWKGEDGQEHEEVAFIDVTAFGRTAENCGQYLRKGRPVLVEGRLKLETWDDKQTGAKRSKLIVIVETVQFLGSGREEGDAPRQERLQSAPANRPISGKPPGVEAPYSTENDGEDVPF